MTPAASPPLAPSAATFIATRSGTSGRRNFSSTTRMNRSRGRTVTPSSVTGSVASKPSSRIAHMIFACPGYRNVLYSIRSTRPANSQGIVEMPPPVWNPSSSPSGEGNSTGSTSESASTCTGLRSRSTQDGVV